MTSITAGWVAVEISIIKLGGSVITNERIEGYYDHQNTLRLAQELLPYCHGTILIHGTGLIGKPPAITYGYFADGHISADQRLLALRIRNDLRRLNQQVVSTFLSVSVPATPRSVEHFYDESFSKLRDERLSVELKNTVCNGQVPVFYGDLMPLSDGSFQVFSSDVITLILAKQLRPRRCVFLTNAPGVYSKDSGGKSIMERLDSHTLHLMDRPESSGKDVSGGMWAKVNCALEVSRYCKQCYIASGVNAGVLSRIMEGEEIVATQVCAS